MGSLEKHGKLEWTQVICLDVPSFGWEETLRFKKTLETPSRGEGVLRDIVEA